ncbi:M15 family metallopeptidase [Demequina sp. NBRC 110052]|uniref:M15 family metallopeptidase n=1 Tax=Demequina sp. NBRC 110052 TaxID=1570341 RepID=UPI0013564001|nr:M15 family metallopeptidase [Demequina sp. NBRC 110052]
MSSTQSRLRTLAASSAIACVVVGAGAVGANAATVEVALLQAEQAARQVETKRQSLAESLTRAVSATAAAEPHLTQADVSAAVDELDVTVQTVAAERALDSVVIEVTPSEPLPPLLPAEPVATPAEAIGAPEVVAATANQTPTLTQLGASTAVEAAVEVVPDREVQSVLDREERDLGAVRAATAELERTAAALDEAAADVARVVDEVSGVTARLELLQATDDLAAVGTQITDPATLTRAASARTALDAALTAADDAAAASEADDVAQDSARADELARDIEAAAAELSEAMTGLRASHLAWVEAENTRVDALNAKATSEYEQAVAGARAAVTDRYRAAVAEHQNGWSGAPDGVSYSNGRIPSSQLCDIPYAAGHRLQCDAAAALLLADADFHAQTGRHLTLTDTYRSYSLQVATRAAKPTTAAPPGTSNHGWGMAVDFYPEAAAWMAANGADYGWVHPQWARPGGSKPESWHLEFVAPGVGSADLPEAPVLLERVTSALAADV